jgi:hypothetical protein
MCELTHDMAGERHGRGRGTACYVESALRGVKIVMVLSNMSLGKTFITCLVGRNFTTGGFYMKHETLSLRK